MTALLEIQTKSITATLRPLDRDKAEKWVGPTPPIASTRAVMSMALSTAGRPQSLKKPKLLDNFDKMNPEDREKALIKLKHEQANLYHTAATGLKCERQMRALRLPYLEMRQYLIKQAGMPWDGNLVNLRAALIGIHSKWNDLVGEYPCPISFTDNEVRTAIQESEE